MVKKKTGTSSTSRKNIGKKVNPGSKPDKSSRPAAGNYYGELFDFAPIGYLSLDQDGVIQEANLAAAALLGAERSQLTGTCISDFIALEYLARYYQHCQSALSGNTVVCTEMDMHKTDGTLITVRMESASSGEREERSLRTMLIDISDDKNTTQTLQQINEQLEQQLADQTDKISLLATAISNLGEGILITNDNLDWPGPHIVFVNEAMCRITGYTADELIGQSPRILQGSEPDRITLDQIRNELSTGDMCKHEVINYRKDGTPYHAEVIIKPMFDENNFSTHFVSVHRDITDRKLAEESLRQEQELNEGMINTAQHIVLLLDKDGKINRFNPYMEELTGWSLNEVRGKDWFDTFLPKYGREGINKRFKSALSGMRTRAGVNSIMTRDGRELEVEWYDAPLTDAKGELIGLLCTGQDITERKRAEETLRQDHVQLEQRVRERTDDLEQAKREAELANTSKSRFLAAASHDLRQPLQSIGMYLSVLSREPGISAGQLEICDKIHTSLDTINNLLNALLDISRLQSGAITPEKKDFPLRDILSWIITDTKQQAEEKGLRLDYFLCDSTVHTDPSLLERIIENFVINAIRYTEQGEIIINCQPGEDKTVISVTDTGVGIPQEELQLIFEEYYQLDNPMRDRYKGLGLGLSIVKHIAQLLDHKLDVRSTPGQGSTFTIEVPLGAAVVKSPMSRPAMLHINREQQPVVLLVENDQAVADATIMLLKSADFQVYWATCASDALAHVSEGINPNVLVCDYRLPGEKGTEVIRRVRQGLDKTLPAVILTGDTSLKESVFRGLDDCTMLHKPVDGERLIAVIEKFAAARSP